MEAEPFAVAVRLRINRRIQANLVSAMGYEHGRLAGEPLARRVPQVRRDFIALVGATEPAFHADHAHEV